MGGQSGDSLAEVALRVGVEAASLLGVLICNWRKMLRSSEGSEVLRKCSLERRGGLPCELRQQEARYRGCRGCHGAIQGFAQSIDGIES